MATETFGEMAIKPVPSVVIEVTAAVPRPRNDKKAPPLKEIVGIAIKGDGKSMNPNAPESSMAAALPIVVRGYLPKLLNDIEEATPFAMYKTLPGPPFSAKTSVTVTLKLQYATEV